MSRIISIFYKIDNEEYTRGDAIKETLFTIKNMTEKEREEEVQSIIKYCSVKEIDNIRIILNRINKEEETAKLFKDQLDKENVNIFDNLLNSKEDGDLIIEIQNIDEELSDFFTDVQAKNIAEIKGYLLEFLKHFPEEYKKCLDSDNKIDIRVLLEKINEKFYKVSKEKDKKTNKTTLLFKRPFKSIDDSKWEYTMQGSGLLDVVTIKDNNLVGADVTADFTATIEGDSLVNHKYALARLNEHIKSNEIDITKSFEIPDELSEILNSKEKARESRQSFITNNKEEYERIFNNIQYSFYCITPKIFTNNMKVGIKFSVIIDYLSGLATSHEHRFGASEITFMEELLNKTDIYFSELTKVKVISEEKDRYKESNNNFKDMFEAVYDKFKQEIIKEVDGKDISILENKVEFLIRYNTDRLKFFNNYHNIGLKQDIKSGEIIDFHNVKSNTLFHDVYNHIQIHFDDERIVEIKDNINQYINTLEEMIEYIDSLDLDKTTKKNIIDKLSIDFKNLGEIRKKEELLLNSNISNNKESWIEIVSKELNKHETIELTYTPNIYSDIFNSITRMNSFIKTINSELVDIKALTTQELEKWLKNIEILQKEGLDINIEMIPNPAKISNIFKSIKKIVEARLEKDKMSEEKDDKTLERNINKKQKLIDIFEYTEEDNYTYDTILKAINRYIIYHKIDMEMFNDFNEEIELLEINTNNFNKVKKDINEANKYLLEVKEGLENILSNNLSIEIQTILMNIIVNSFEKDTLNEEEVIKKLSNELNEKTLNMKKGK